MAVGQLFDRYYTLDTGQSSTGLGLSIARALTEEMGCTISADYADGRLTVLADFSPAREPSLNQHAPPALDQGRWGVL